MEGEGGKKKQKTEMTTKRNLINLDSVPPPDKFSVEEEEGEGKLFFFFLRDVFPEPRSFPAISLPSQVEKAMGCMGSDNASTPVE